MRTRLPVILLFLIISAAHAQAQTKYWVFFKDKDQSRPFDYKAYFDQKAIERREVQHLPAYEYTDLPVKQHYTEAVSAIADSAGQVSRWMNGMGAWLTTTEVEKIRLLPFVTDVQQMTAVAQPAQTHDIPLIDNDDSLTFYYQLRRFNPRYFTSRHINGKGVRIAILDVGFKNANIHQAFKAIFDSSRVMKTYDFIKKQENVYDHGEHGTMVMSCIAGDYHGKPMGLAPAAEFLLARTERNYVELLEEEDNWLAAAEWADKLGAQIISCSLGYTNRHYFTRDMNGHTSIISRAATMAAHKGILVITAAGNDGDSWWKYICTPGDADSVITVGGIDPIRNYHIGFSSYGPTADGRLKPDVSALASDLVATPDGRYTVAQGTSFSTPLVAGFAACVLQLHPDWKPEKAIREIQKSSSLYPYFDYAHGYGTPHANYFFHVADSFPKKAKEPEFASNDTTLTLDIDDSAYIDSTGLFADSTPYLYYKILDSTGHITRYAVVKLEENPILTFPVKDLPKKGAIIVRYEAIEKEYHY
jgi:subtilisin family serine protease